MTTTQIANRLVSLCREAKWEEAQTELYANDAVSIEAEGSEAFSKETKGLSAIIEKGRKFTGMVEKLHSLTVSEPLVAEDAFACTMSLDMDMKGRGRVQFAEVCVYDVKDGKIISERFHQ